MNKKIYCKIHVSFPAPHLIGREHTIARDEERKRKTLALLEKKQKILATLYPENNTKMFLGSSIIFEFSKEYNADLSEFLIKKIIISEIQKEVNPSGLNIQELKDEKYLYELTKNKK